MRRRRRRRRAHPALERVSCSSARSRPTKQVQEGRNGQLRAGFGAVCQSCCTSSTTIAAQRHRPRPVRHPRPPRQLPATLLSRPESRAECWAVAPVLTDIPRPRSLPAASPALFNPPRPLSTALRGPKSLRPSSLNTPASAANFPVRPGFTITLSPHLNTHHGIWISLLYWSARSIR